MHIVQCDASVCVRSSVGGGVRVCAKCVRMHMCECVPECVHVCISVLDDYAFLFHVIVALHQETEQLGRVQVLQLLLGLGREGQSREDVSSPKSLMIKCACPCTWPSSQQAPKYLSACWEVGRVSPLLLTVPNPLLLTVPNRSALP
jgi:hypothetical protein